MLPLEPFAISVFLLESENSLSVYQPSKLKDSLDGARSVIVSVSEV